MQTRVLKYALNFGLILFTITLLTFHYDPCKIVKHVNNQHVNYLFPIDWRCHFWDSKRWFPAFSFTLSSAPTAMHYKQSLRLVDWVIWARL